MKQIFPVRIFWLIALAVTLVAVWFAPDPEADDADLNLLETPSPASVSGSNVAIRATQGRTVAPSLQLLKVRERTAIEKNSVFSIPPWNKPEPVEDLPVAVVPKQQKIEAPPSAPSLPFRFIGRYIENESTKIFLLDAKQSWIVSEGDIVAESYKVERIAVDGVHLRYLPLDELQVLEISAKP